MSLPTIILVSRSLLAVVFAIAGIAKLLDVSGSRRALSEFGVPKRLARPFGAALPVVELIVAAALLPQSTALLAAAAALVLLIAFVSVISVNLARGRAPDCHCFGQLHSQPAGRGVLARNATLAALAILVLVTGWNDPGPSAVAWFVPLKAIEKAIVVGGSIAIALLTTQTILLLKLVGKSSQPAEQSAVADNAGATQEKSVPASAQHVTPLAPGTAAPEFALQSLENTTVMLSALRALGKPIVLMFSDPGCGPCSALLPRVSQWQREHDQSITIAIVSRGTLSANRAKAEEHKLTRVLLQTDREVSLAYGIVGTPSALMVRADGTIASEPAFGEAAITRIVLHAVQSVVPKVESAPPQNSIEPESTLDTSVVEERPSATVTPTAVFSEPTSVAFGSVPPAFALPDLDGRNVQLADYLGRPTIVLFWSCRCGFCMRMVGDLKAREEQPSENQAQLLMVSTGTVEENRDLGLASTIVLDQEFAVGQQYGVQGTPSAVLIDRDGLVARGPVTGAQSILALFAMETGTGLPASAVPVKRETVEDELLSDGSMILYNRSTQQVLTVNGTAALIWECCDGEHSVAAIIAEVADVFFTNENVERDVRQFLARLIQDGMVSVSRASADATLDPAASITIG